MANQVTGLLSPWLRRQRIAAALPYLRGRVLDFGCGAGELAKYVGARDYLGYDLDAASIVDARARYPAYTFASENALGDRRFDTIVALAVVEHLPDVPGWLSWCREHLNADGSLVLTTPHPSLEWSHDLGAKVGLFSAEAADEHHTLFNRALMQKTARQSRFELASYERFLFGANQLFVLTPRA